MGSRSFAVIGLGTFGSTVAADLAKFGNFVLGIDIESEPVSAMADDLRESMIADGRDENALREAGVGQCDVVVVGIGALEANIVCAMNAKVIGIDEIWAKALSRTHHRILSRLGVDRVIQPERLMGQRVAQMLHNPLVRDYVSMGNGFYAVTIVVPKALEGRKLGDLGLESTFSLRCVEVMRGSEHLSKGTDETEIAEDDRLLVLGRRSDLRDFSDSL